MNYRVCPVCLYEYPKPEENPRKYLLSMLDINGTRHKEMEVRSWLWSVRDSKAGNRMVSVRYYPKNLGDSPVNEFLMLWHENDYVKGKAVRRMNYLASHAGIETWAEFVNVEDLCRQMNNLGKPPKRLIWHNEDKYPKVDMVFWNDVEEKEDAEI